MPSANPGSPCRGLVAGFPKIGGSRIPSENSGCPGREPPTGNLGVCAFGSASPPPPGVPR
ncbi:hypothetical protein BKA69DRAFT_1086494 [Paraphysoderma sedebokerense]|nr:hypothetical protein BKA69DRAFT_1086494 [Paraphysoderma sedebokerense]